MERQISFYEHRLAYETDSADLFEALKNGKNIIVIDARSGSSFQREHIPGAVNLPHREMDEQSTRFLNREILYIIYCDGIGCNASTKGALKMARLGFKVKELLGGLDWWKRDDYATEGDAGGGLASAGCSC